MIGKKPLLFCGLIFYAFRIMSMFIILQSFVLSTPYLTCGIESLNGHTIHNTDLVNSYLQLIRVLKYFLELQIEPKCSIFKKSMDILKKLFGNMKTIKINHIDVIYHKLNNIYSYLHSVRCMILQQAPMT